MTSVPEQPRLAALHKANGGAGMPLPLTQQGARLQARADTAYTADWTPEEQVALDATLDKYPAGRYAPLERYVRAAAALAKKGVRDVALRVKWLASTSSAAKRRMSDESAGKKRPRVQSIFAVQPKGAPPLGPPASGVPATGVPAAYPLAVQGVMPLLDDHGSHSVGMVGGPMAHLLEQNYLILNQYKQNMQQYKVHENTDLLVRFRNNILTILNQMNSMSGLMQDMPPLPVRLNIELASDFLPKAGSSMYSAGSQPIIQASNALQSSAAYRMPPESSVPLQPSMKAAPVVPVSSAPLNESLSKAQEGRGPPGRSKSKGGARRGAVKTEERGAKGRSELRTSARRAALKSQPSKTEVRTSARLAAASDTIPN